MQSRLSTRLYVVVRLLATLGFFVSPPASVFEDVTEVRGAAAAVSGMFL